MNLSRLKLPATIALCSLLGACASTQSQSKIKIQQNEALQRWVNCVDRQTEIGTASEALFRVDTYCEGHKRDLLAAYPAHLESQVSTVLTERTRKLAVEQLAAKFEEGTIPVTLK